MKLNSETNQNKRPFYPEFSDVSDKEIYRKVKLDNRMNMNLISQDYLLNKVEELKVMKKMTDKKFQEFVIQQKAQKDQEKMFQKFMIQNKNQIINEESDSSVTHFKIKKPKIKHKN